jgi:hypothetical protein
MARKLWHLPPHSEMRFALETVPFLWLVMPWLIGSAAVAEERKLGTMGTEFSLPVARRLQFMGKFCVALLLGVALGGICPGVIERIGLMFNISSELIPVAQIHELQILSINIPGKLIQVGQIHDLKIMSMVAAAITVISFYASTLTRNALHALGAAVMFGGAFLGIFTWHNPDTQSLFSEVLKNCSPVLITLLLLLAYSNFKSIDVDRQLWFRNISVLLVACAVMWILNAIFFVPTLHFGGFY